MQVIRIETILAYAVQETLQRSPEEDRVQSKAGEQIEVDWAGVRPYWQDPDSGEKVYGWFFEAVLPFSGLGFAYVTPDMKMPSWIQCHIKMYEFFGGVTTILTPDNLKTGITEYGGVIAPANR